MYTPKKGSKTAAIIEFVKAKSGATTAEIAEKFGMAPYQVLPLLAHPVHRGALSVIKVPSGNLTPQNKYLPPEERTTTVALNWVPATQRKKGR